MEFEYRFQTRTKETTRRRADAPFRLLVAGDFSGRENRGLLETGDGLAARPVPAVDLNTLETVFSGYAPVLRLSLGPEEPPVEVAPGNLEGFHPDRLYESVAVFPALRSLRDRLGNASTFAAAAEELLGRDPGAAPSPAETSTPAAKKQSPESTDDMFDRLLGKAPSSAPRARGTGGNAQIASLIADIVAPHISPDPDPRAEALVASVDEAIGARMAAILHHPEFQGMEALWKAVERMIGGLEIGESFRLHLVDVSREELVEDLRAAGDRPEASGWHRLLAASSAGTAPWSLVLGDFSFGPEPADLASLNSLGAVASLAGAPFLAAATPRFLGLDSLAGAGDPGTWSELPEELETHWSAFRRGPAAPWIGLALPRVLTRLPYGKKTDPIESFAFDEASPERGHENYLWSNPALACGQLIAEAFLRSGWTMEPGDVSDLGDLPTHVYDENGEARLMACAEAYLSERAGEALLRCGLMPLLSYRDRGAVRVLRFQSPADPPTPLAGPWN